MDHTFAFYGVAAFSVLLTGLSKSGFGGGLGVMAVPMMSLFVTPQFAAAVMMPILLAMDVLIVWRYRRTMLSSSVVNRTSWKFWSEILLVMISPACTTTKNISICVVGLMYPICGFAIILN